MTRLYGVLGDPIAHSLSPLIHKGWMRKHNLAADYLALQVPSGEFDTSLETLDARGFTGFNVTLPHKEAALKACNLLTERARSIGAVNTMWRADETSWHGDNTDATGFHAALMELVETDLSGQTILVLGAGGAARAIVFALHKAGVQIKLANRTRARANALLQSYTDTDHSVLSFEEGIAKTADIDCIINTTSLGHMAESVFPDLPPGKNRLFYDISYGKAADAVLGPAHAAGWRIADGLSMLVWQAAFAFEHWFGILPDTEDTLLKCRRTLEAVQ